MSKSFEDWISLEHRDDYTYLILNPNSDYPREFIVTNAQPPHANYGYGGGTYTRVDHKGESHRYVDPHCRMVLDLYAVPVEPAKPKHRPVKRSWSKAMGLRRPG